MIWQRSALVFGLRDTFKSSRQDVCYNRDTPVFSVLINVAAILSLELWVVEIPGGEAFLMAYTCWL